MKGLTFCSFKINRDLAITILFIMPQTTAILSYETYNRLFFPFLYPLSPVSPLEGYPISWVADLVVHHSIGYTPCQRGLFECILSLLVVDGVGLCSRISDVATFL